MKRILPVTLFALFLTACLPETNDDQFEQVSGELNFRAQIDWSELPGNQTVIVTPPKTITKIIPINVEDFGVPPETIISFPYVSAFYYDINNLNDLASIGEFNFTISVVYNGGFVERLASINISDLTNTVDNQGVLTKIPIFDADNTSVANVIAINLINQSLLRGNLFFQIEAVGQNVILPQAGEVFDIVFSLNLNGAVAKK